MGLLIAALSGFVLFCILCIAQNLFQFVFTNAAIGNKLLNIINAAHNLNTGNIVYLLTIASQTRINKFDFSWYRN